jgi:hypothetical protein
MAKKKKKLEDDAWMWMSQPSVPGVGTSMSILGPTRGTTISSMGSGLSVKEWATFQLQQQSLREGAFPAYLYYGRAGLADPKAPVEAYGYGGFLGLSGWRRAAAGTLVGGIIGFAIGGTIGVIVDPLHQHEGGWDETADYQETQRMYAEMRAPWKTQYVPTM